MVVKYIFAVIGFAAVYLSFWEYPHRFTDETRALFGAYYCYAVLVYCLERWDRKTAGMTRR